ncbi:hypothetical protein T11_597 [Trichinella zimbabwensis]|uniref:Uncharacterized protein n=1 Tax=Trichinella zimbabwensis TaxID=268475 RepID=A0A0V1HBG9_9BILA|nr:hypothetical protein T11_597 [Trichinella zimbabwensis]
MSSAKRERSRKVTTNCIDRRGSPQTESKPPVYRSLHHALDLQSFGSSHVTNPDEKENNKKVRTEDTAFFTTVVHTQLPCQDREEEKQICQNSLRCWADGFGFQIVPRKPGAPKYSLRTSE